MKLEFLHHARRPSVAIAGLSILFLISFLLVNRMVERFRQQEKALGRHLFAQGLLWRL